MAAPKIMILSTSFGDGHLQVAFSIKEAITQLAKDAQVDIFDYYQHMSPFVNKILRSCYISSFILFPSLYGFSYRFVEDPTAGSNFTKRILNSFGKEHLYQLIDKHRPDIIVNTFPSTGGTVSLLKEKQAIDIPCATIITDYDFHSQWLHSGIDYYFVATGDIKKRMQMLGIEPGKIFISGIPVRSSFFSSFSPSRIRAGYGLRSDCPTVLLMTGAYGVLPDVKGICRILAAMNSPVQVMIVCGKNIRLYNRLKQSLHGNKYFRIFSYVDNMEELMGSADLIITKAGCLTVTEALHMRLPILIYRPIPGQEEKNAEFLMRHGAAFVSYGRSELETLLKRLLSAEGQRDLSAMRARMASLVEFNPSTFIARHVLDMASGVPS